MISSIIAINASSSALIWSFKLFSCSFSSFSVSLSTGLTSLNAFNSSFTCSFSSSNSAIFLPNSTCCFSICSITSSPYFATNLILSIDLCTASLLAFNSSWRAFSSFLSSAIASSSTVSAASNSAISAFIASMLSLVALSSSLSSAF